MSGEPHEEAGYRTDGASLDRKASPAADRGTPLALDWWASPALGAETRPSASWRLLAIRWALARIACAKTGSNCSVTVAVNSCNQRPNIGGSRPGTPV